MGEMDSAAPTSADSEHRITTQAEWARELARGRWVIFMHEYLPEDQSLDEWIEVLQWLCDGTRTPISVATNIRNELTVIVNLMHPPNDEELAYGLQRIAEIRKGALLAKNLNLPQGWDKV